MCLRAFGFWSSAGLRALKILIRTSLSLSALTAALACSAPPPRQGRGGLVPRDPVILRAAVEPRTEEVAEPAADWDDYWRFHEQQEARRNYDQAA
jgi:hypothetical protein